MVSVSVGQMFAGLTLANVLGVPAGTWIGNAFGYWLKARLSLICRSRYAAILTRN